MNKRIGWMISALLTVLILVTGGCSLFLTVSSQDAPGAADTKRFEGEATRLKIEKIQFGYGTDSLGPEVWLYEDGGASRAEIEAPPAAMEKIKVDFSGGRLHIQGPGSTSFRLDSGVKIVVRLYNYDFSELVLAGACRLKADHALKADEFSLDLSGASECELPEVSCRRMKLNLSGASYLDIEKLEMQESGDWHISGAASFTVHDGTGGELFAVISGASVADTDGFGLTKVTMTISGASRWNCRVTGLLGGSISGASYVRYSGNPETATSVTGSSQLVKGDQ